MEATLRWRHLAPTAPDTLTCYPFTTDDPFVLTECPHVYVAGNQPEFATRVATGGRLRGALGARAGGAGALAASRTRAPSARRRRAAPAVCRARAAPAPPPHPPPRPPTQTPAASRCG
jgi:hypothetical protein